MHYRGRDRSSRRDDGATRCLLDPADADNRSNRLLHRDFKKAIILQFLCSIHDGCCAHPFRCLAVQILELGTSIFLVPSTHNLWTGAYIPQPY